LVVYHINWISLYSQLWDIYKLNNVCFPSNFYFNLWLISFMQWCIGKYIYGYTHLKVVEYTLKNFLAPLKNLLHFVFNTEVYLRFWLPFFLLKNLNPKYLTFNAAPSAFLKYASDLIIFYYEHLPLMCICRYM